jgi:hypothetical protein
LALGCGIGAPTALAQSAGNSAVGNSNNSGLNMNLMQGRRPDPEAEERQKKIDNDYQAVKSSIPEKKTTTDPWGNMRGNAQPAQEKNSEKKKRHSNAR